jgi:hypothetical protein
MAAIRALIVSALADLGGSGAVPDPGKPRRAGAWR